MSGHTPWRAIRDAQLAWQAFKVGHATEREALSRRRWFARLAKAESRHRRLVRDVMRETGVSEMRARLILEAERTGDAGVSSDVRDVSGQPTRRGRDIANPS